MSVEPANMQVTADSNRKVWVLNDYHEPYTEVFRGETIVVPPSGEKKLLMPFLAARRFLGQPVAPADPLPDGTYRNTPKMLRTVELTEEEYKVHIGGKRPSSKEAEDKAALTCTLCGFNAVSSKGLKIHTTKEHPHDVPVEEDLDDTSAISRGSEATA